MKKFVALVLVLSLLVFTGCDTNVPDSTTQTQTDPIPEESLIRPPEPKEDPFVIPPEYDVPPTIQVQYLPAEVDGAQDVPVLKWVCFMESFYGGNVGRVWNEEAVHELNDMLDNLEAGFRVQFVMLTADRGTFFYDWFTRQEVLEEIADADLIFGHMLLKDMKQYLTPITEYTTGMLKNAVPHSAYWSCGTVDGEVYGILARSRTAVTTGWFVDETLMDELELTSVDLSKNFWETDEVLNKIAAISKGPFLSISKDNISTDAKETLGRGYYPSSLSGGLESVQKVGSCYAIDYSGETPQVVNYLELEGVRKFQEAVVRYKKLGYVNTSMTSEGKLRYGFSYQMDPVTEDGRLYVPVTEPVFNTASPSYYSGIAAGSENKKEAASLLGLIANSEDFRMQLFFGKEGRDYIVKDGLYSIVKQEDGSDYSMDFLSPLAYFCDLTQDPANSSTRSPATEDNINLPGESGQEKLENLRKALDKARITIPINFDYTGYEKELEEIKWILRRYYPYITSEKAYPSYNIPEMTPALYDLMLEDLEEKDSNILLQELQEQLDEWLEKNPDWNK